MTPSPEARPDLEARAREALTSVHFYSASCRARAIAAITAVLLESEELQRDLRLVEDGHREDMVEAKRWREERDTALADLAALRRRVGETLAGDDDDVRSARIQGDCAGWEWLGRVVERYDASRAAAGELRGMLREAVRLLKDRPAPRSAPDSYGNLWQHEVSELTNRPDVLAAIKEEPGT